MWINKWSLLQNGALSLNIKINNSPGNFLRGFVINTNLLQTVIFSIRLQASLIRAFAQLVQKADCNITI